MPIDPENKLAKKARKPRRNFAREVERIELYISTVIRIIEASDTNDLIDAKLKGLKDVLAYMREIAEGAK